MTKPNKFFLLKVTTNDEYLDDTAEAAVVEITPKLKAIILDAQKTILALKTKHEHVYDLRFFDYTPSFLAFGEADKLAGETDIVDKEIVPIDEKVFAQAVIVSEENNIRMDTVIMHVSDTTVRWSAIYKHCTVEAETENIPIKNL